MLEKVIEFFGIEKYTNIFILLSKKVAYSLLAMMETPITLVKVMENIST